MTADFVLTRRGAIGAGLAVAGLASLPAELLATIEAHKQWSKNLEPYIVSGTPRWEVFRILADSRGGMM